MKEDLVFLNGKIMYWNQAGISVSDQGFMYGWGVFETIRVYKGMPFLLEQHIDRMTAAAVKLTINLHFSKEEVVNQVMAFVNVAEINDRVIKLMLTKGSKDSSNMIITQRPVQYQKDNYEKGFSVKVSEMRRNTASPLAYVKTLNYLDNILAKREAVGLGYQEALLLNTQDKLCEGSMSNLFFIHKGKLYTPSVACGLLPGITRNFVIDTLAPTLGLAVEQGEYGLSRLTEADEAFLTNSVIQIMPLVSVGDNPIGNGAPGKITQTIMKAYDDYRFRALK